MAKKSALPLTRVLGAIDKRDMNFYSTLNDEERKAFSPWLMMRYTSSSSVEPEHYLLMVNTFVNTNFADFSKHPELQWKLLALCGIGKPHMHPWIPVAKKKKKDPILVELSKLYPTLKDDDIEVLRSLHDYEELKNLFIDSGYQDKEIKELFK